MKFFPALIYPFKEKNGIFRLILAFVVGAIPVVGFFIIKGWEFEISMNVRHGKEQLIPGWKNPVQKLWRGVTLRLTGFAFNLPMWIVFVFSFFSAIAILAVYIWKGADRETTAEAFINIWLGGIGVYASILLAVVLLHILGNFLYNSGYLHYIETGEYRAFFTFKANLKKSFELPFDDIIMELYVLIALGFVGLVGSGLGTVLASTGIGITLIPFVVQSVTVVFMSWFTGHLFGQLARRTYAPSK